MYMIAGLGNPGKKYEKTRHNMGFAVLDELAERHHVSLKEKMHALCGTGTIRGQKVLLVKPLTYMNLSGDAVRALAGYYGIAPEDVLVVFDDISLELGQIRLRQKGSAGGHNGVKSLIARLETSDFPRVKMGVGAKPDQMDLVDYVLGHFSKEEQVIVRQEIKLGADAVEAVLEDGVEAAMNQFNGRRVE